MNLALTALAIGYTARYTCTRRPCPVAVAYGDTLIGFPGCAYICECGAPMEEQYPEPAETTEPTP